MLHIKPGAFHLRAFAIVILESPFTHGGVGKAPAFQILYGVKVFPALLGCFTLHAPRPLALTFCRVAVAPEQGGFLCREKRFFGCPALAAVQKPVLPGVVL